MTTDYWSAPNLLVSVAGPDKSYSAHLDKPFAMIGTRDDCDIVIPNAKLSRRKYYLHSVADGIFFVDLSPRWSDGPIQGWLEPKQILQFGDYEISIQSDHETEVVAPQESELTARGSLDALGPTLQILHDGKTIGRQILSRRLTIIGRKKPSTITLSSRTLSRLHCALFVENGDLWLIDLKSRDGTFIEEQRVDVARYAWGTPISIGRIGLVCENPWITAEEIESLKKLDGTFEATIQTVDDDLLAAVSLDDETFDLEPPNEEARRRAKYLSMKSAINDLPIGATVDTKQKSEEALNQLRIETAREKFKWANFCRSIKSFIVDEINELEELRTSLIVREKQLRAGQAELLEENDELKTNREHLELESKQLETARQQQLDEHETSLRELRELRDQLNRQQLQFEQSQQQLNESTQLVNDKCGALENDRQEFEQQRLATERQLAADQDDLQQIQNDMSAQRNELSVREREIQSAAEQVDVDRAALAQQSQDFESARAEHQKQQAKEYAELEQLRNDIDEQSRQLAERQREIELVAQQVADEKASALVRAKKHAESEVQTKRQQLDDQHIRWEEDCQAKQETLFNERNELERLRNDLDQRQQQLEQTQSDLQVERERLTSDQQRGEQATLRLETARRELQEQLINKIAETDQLRDSLLEQQASLEQREQEFDDASRMLQTDSSNLDKSFTHISRTTGQNDGPHDDDDRVDLDRWRSELEEIHRMIAQREVSLSRETTRFEEQRADFTQELLQLETARKEQMENWSIETEELNQKQKKLEQRSQHLHQQQKEIDQALKQLKQDRATLREQTVHFESAHQETEKRQSNKRLELEQLKNELESQVRELQDRRKEIEEAKATLADDRLEFQKEQSRVETENAQHAERVAKRRIRLAKLRKRLKQRARDLDQGTAQIVDQRLQEWDHFFSQWEGNILRLDEFLQELKAMAPQADAYADLRRNRSLFYRVRNWVAKFWRKSR